MNYELMYDEAIQAAQMAGFVGFSPAAVIYMQYQLIENDNTTMQELVAERDALRVERDTLRAALQEIVAYGKIEGDIAAQHPSRIARHALEKATGESPST